MARQEQTHLERREDIPYMVSAEELRQYFFCPRIPFLRYVRRVHPYQTQLMKVGLQFHEEVLHSPRSSTNLPVIVRSPRDQEGVQQYHGIYLESESLHLLASLDLFECEGEEIYPVEIKTGSAPRAGRNLHHLVQLTAQALLLEEAFHTMVIKAKIIYLDPEEVRWVNIEINHKTAVLRAIEQIRQAIESEVIPLPTRHPEKCHACEYWKWCRRV